MKNIIIISFAFFSLTGISQNKYESGMNKAFELWNENKVWEAANLFERIASAEPDNWLPVFYAAQINVIYSFGEKDETKLKLQLDKAKILIDNAKSISMNNAEIMVVEAQYYTAWIAFDGQHYGMKYSGKVAEMYRKADQLAPDDPRVVLGQAEWDMGSAKFFGQPMETYCKDIARAIELFGTFIPVSEFHPKRGLERAKEVLNISCNK